MLGNTLWVKSVNKRDNRSVSALISHNFRQAKTLSPNSEESIIKQNTKWNLYINKNGEISNGEEAYSMAKKTMMKD